MPGWLTIVLSLGGSALINAIVVFLFNKAISSADARKRRADEIVEAMYEKDEAMRLGMQLLLKKQLRTKHSTCVRKGYATVEDKEEFEETYKVYHSLGQNGVMDRAREEIMHLPTEKHSS